MNGEKLKNKIKKRAKEIGAQPQELMQMYFFERLLYRISISQYKFNFILKGGLLLSAIIGDERRTTSDMDTMIKGIDIESDELLKFRYKSLFDDTYIKIMAFNKETIIAEKFETLIKDTETNTRAKDFYDLYVLIKEYWNELDKANLIKAILNICKRRESLYILDELEERFVFIKESSILQGEWNKYQIAHLYARDIDYADIMKNINLIIEELAKEVATI